MAATGPLPTAVSSDVISPAYAGRLAGLPEIVEGVLCGYPTLASRLRPRQTPLLNLQGDLVSLAVATVRAVAGSWRGSMCVGSPVGAILHAASGSVLPVSRAVRSSCRSARPRRTRDQQDCYPMLGRGSAVRAERKPPPASSGRPFSRVERQFRGQLLSSQASRGLSRLSEGYL